MADSQGLKPAAANTVNCGGMWSGWRRSGGSFRWGRGSEGFCVRIGDGGGAVSTGRRSTGMEFTSSVPEH